MTIPRLFNRRRENLRRTARAAGLQAVGILTRRSRPGEGFASRSRQAKPRTAKMSSSTEARPPIIHWFRKDLRLADNPALAEAAESGRPVVAVYVLEPADSDPWAPGGAGRWWLHHSLLALNNSLMNLGNRLVLRRGRSRDILPELARETGATAVHVERLAEPRATELDAEIENLLKPLGVKLRVFGGNLLFPPEEIKTKGGGPYKVFTPFYKACLGQAPPDSPTPPPASLPCLRSPVKSDSLDDWQLPPSKPDWSAGWLDIWTPGEEGALARLEKFLENSATGYEEKRNRPDLEGTSRLSPHLHFGEISARACWRRATSDIEPEAEKGAESFLRQLVWREFSRHLLYHWPTFPEKPFRKEFSRFPWARDETALGLWQRGLTGYPIVDAGMRELRATGWMHNRVRMIAASFLVKHLLVPWQDRSRVVLGHARGRRPRKQFRRLAVGGGLRRGRRSFLSHIQPDIAGQEIRPRRRLCATLDSRACRSFEQAYSRTMESVKTRTGKSRSFAWQGLSFLHSGPHESQSSCFRCIQESKKLNKP